MKAYSNNLFKVLLKTFLIVLIILIFLFAGGVLFSFCFRCGGAEAIYFPLKKTEWPESRGSLYYDANIIADLHAASESLRETAEGLRGDPKEKPEYGCFITSITKN